MASDRYLDLMKQGFMKPHKVKKPKPKKPVVACERCENWHEDGKHTKKKSGGMSAKALAMQYEERAKTERAAGGSCVIDPYMPSVSIKMSDGQEFYYQEWQADKLVDEAKKDLRKNGMTGLVSIPDYLLATFQNA